MELKELNLNEEQMLAVQKLVQSECDKIRTDYSQKLKSANDELLKYKPVEKTDDEKALESRLAEIESREKALSDKERSMTISTKLKEKSLPEGLAKYLNLGEDVDKAIQEIGTLMGNYLLEGTHKPTDHQNSKGITKEDFRKMGYIQRVRLLNENPALYDLLNR